MANLVETISYEIYEHQPITERNIMRLRDIFRARCIAYPNELLLSIQAKYDLMKEHDFMGVPLYNSQIDEIYGMKIKIDPELSDGEWSLRKADSKTEAIHD